MQGHHHQVCCAALGTEVPGHRQEQLTQTMIVRLKKIHFFDVPNIVGEGGPFMTPRLRIWPGRRENSRRESYTTFRLGTCSCCI